jgi:hypothetical protein
MSKSNPDMLRYVPTESCARCGEAVQTEQRAFVLADRERDEEGDTESGNLCADCFDHLVGEISG